MVSVLYLVTDLAMTIAAFVTAYGVRSFLGTFADLRLGPLASLVDYFPLLLLILVFWALVAFADGLYGRRASRSLGTEVSRVARTVGVSGLLVAFGLFTLSGEGTGGAAFRLEYVSRPVILLFLLLNGPFVVAGRSLVRAFVLDLTTRRHVLVAGNREQVLRTAVNVDSHRDL
jgi:hypothetical protein